MTKCRDRYVKCLIVVSLLGFIAVTVEHTTAAQTKMDQKSCRAEAEVIHKNQVELQMLMTRMQQEWTVIAASLQSLNSMRTTPERAVRNNVDKSKVDTTITLEERQSGVLSAKAEELKRALDTYKANCS